MRPKQTIGLKPRILIRVISHYNWEHPFYKKLTILITGNLVVKFYAKFC